MCDFDFSEGWSASRHAHVIAHHEWEHGVRLRHTAQFELVGNAQEFDLLLVRPFSSKYARSRAERISRRSIREPVSEGGYDKPLYFAHCSPLVLLPHAVLLVRAGYAVGIAVLERRPIMELYRWTNRPHFELVQRIPNTVRWAIVHAWLLPSLRGRGVGTEFVRQTITGVRETPDTVGWLSPYTPAGLRLIARLTMIGFHRAVSDLPSWERVERPFDRNRTAG